MLSKLSFGRTSALAGALLLIVGAVVLAVAPANHGTGKTLLPFGHTSVRNAAESLAPARPDGLTLVPASPSNDPNPILRGSANGADTVTVWKRPDCQGTNHKDYTGAQFENGVQKRARINDTTEFSAISHAGGQDSACSDPVAYVNDQIAPVVSLADPASGSTTSDTTPNFAGTGGTAPRDSDIVTVAIFKGTAASGSPQQVLHAVHDTSNGDYSVEASSALPDGTYTARASQTDSAGNTGQSSLQTFQVVTGHRLPQIAIRSPLDGSLVVKGATLTADYSCADPGGPGLATCSGPVADGAAIATSEVGPHPFSVTASDTAGAEQTRTAHYRVLSPGTITLTRQAKVFRHKGRLWIDTGYVAACPEKGPACKGLVTAHRALHAASLKSERFGHRHLKIKGAHAMRLTFKLGKSRAKELLSKGHIRLRFDVRLGRGTKVLAKAHRTASLKR